MKKKNIVLGVTGSIAAYKAADLASQLTKQGMDVHVILTSDAQKFISALTFSALTHHRVITDLWEDQQEYPTHIQLADQADLLLVAPATAQILAKMAQGFADDVLTCTLLATLAPVMVAPAMNGKMWHHAATQANVATLKKRDVEFIGPEAGLLSCGYEGLGRLWPVEKIVEQVLKRLKKS